MAAYKTLNMKKPTFFSEYFYSFLSHWAEEAGADVTAIDNGRSLERTL